MKQQKQIPDPTTQINVLRRFLHVLALLQKSETDDKNNNQWNAQRIAKVLTKEEDEKLSGKTIIGKSVQDYIDDHLRGKLGLDIDTYQGGWNTTMSGDIDEDMLFSLAKIYASFIIDDTTQDVILKNFLKKHPNDGLWMLATIYFTILYKKTITFNYVTNTGYKINQWKICPYHLFFRNNNLYISAWDPKQEKELVLIVSKISDLKVTSSWQDERSDWPCKKEVPAIDELFKDSLSAFIGTKEKVVLRYDESIKNQIEHFLTILEPETKELDGGKRYEASFTIADREYLCKHLVMFGDKVEIIGSEEIRNTMISMLKKSLSVYE